MATALVVVVALAACQQRGVVPKGGERPLPPSVDGRSGPSPTVSLKDEAGRLVKPRALPARRLVSLAPNVTELLFAIGAGAQVVGVDNYSDQPASEVAHLTKVGSDYEPSLEKIVGLAPDVVLTSLSANRRETVEALERLGIPVFVTDTRALREMEGLLRSLGALTGHGREAEQQIRRLRTGLESVARQVAGRARPRVLVVVWDDPLYVAGQRTFTHDLIEVAGGVNVTSDREGFVRYPLERVLHLAPEVIILPTHSAEEQGPRAVKYWSRWPELPAVRNRRVFAVDDSIISRPGARLVEGATLLARLIHPEAGAP